MGLQENLLKEPVSELRSRPLVLVQRETPVRQVVQLMLEDGVGSAFVVDGDGKIDGKFSERMLIKLLASGEPFMDDPVSKHAGEFWSVVRHDEPIAMVLHKLQQHRMHHLCVVDDAGMPTAMVGQRSVMSYLAEHFPRVVLTQLAGSRICVDQPEGA